MTVDRIGLRIGRHFRVSALGFGMLYFGCDRANAVATLHYWRVEDPSLRLTLEASPTEYARDAHVVYRNYDK